MNKKLIISALFITTSFAVAAERRPTSSKTGGDAFQDIIKRLEGFATNMDANFKTLEKELGSFNSRVTSLNDRVVLIEGFQLAHVAVQINNFIARMEGLGLSYGAHSVEGSMNPLFADYNRNIVPMITASKDCVFLERGALIKAWQSMRVRINEHFRQACITAYGYEAGYKPSLDKIDGFLEQLGVKKEASE